MKIINVWQIAGWNRNVGDWALTYHLHRLLNHQAKALDLFFKFHPIDGQRTFFHSSLVDQMNEEADLIMIGGGGLLFHRPEYKSVSGWAFNISLENLKRIKKPLVVYGLGNNKFRYGGNEFPSQTKTHLRELQNKAALFSVRATGVKEDLINDFGLDPVNIEVIPDTGMFLHDREINLPIKRSAGPLIAFNLAGDRPHYRYSDPGSENEKHFQTVLKSALLRAVKELNAQILYIPHLSVVDFEVYPQFSEGFPAGSIFSTHQELPFLYAPPGELLHPHVPFFTNIYRKLDVVLGMRLHSCLFACGAGTKFISLGAQDKIRHFVQDIGVPEYAVKFVDRRVDTEEAVFKKISDCLADQQYKESIQASLNQQRKILEKFNQKVIDLIK
jgi:polysaccharide pyruvyl transferase WcaK-like protein